MRGENETSYRTRSVEPPNMTELEASECRAKELEAEQRDLVKTGDRYLLFNMAIEEVESTVYRARRLLEKMTEDANPKEPNCASQPRGVITLAQFITDGPERVQKQCAMMNDILGKIETIFF